MSTTRPWPNSLSLAFLEDLYADFLRDPGSVPDDWRRFFQTSGDGHGGDGARLGPSFRPATIFDPRHGDGRREITELHRPSAEVAILQDRVDQLVRAYRVRGHMIARLDPLGRPRPEQPELDPAHYGITAADMDRTVSSRTIAGARVRVLRDILQRLRNTYCRSIGAQFMHIDDINVRHWLQERMEGTENRVRLSRKEQFRILSRLTDAVVFEEFIQKKYVGAKSFSLEGSESLIPLLDLAIEHAGEHDIDEVVIGMAHRGRLNVLANIMDKSPQEIFCEFEDATLAIRDGAGDVKYHLGYSSDWDTAVGRRIHLSLCFNPSHLEYINPVAMGRMRAKQDRVGDTERLRGMVLLIHGDASFAGEGIIQETLNLSELPAYTVGGTIHVIVNNQIGFTTPPEHGRSTLYASAVGKMLQIPIFHVNGENPEAVAQVIRLAMDFRQEFKRDVVIDMYGYRRHGHNEGDEPSFTQPLLYKAIAKRKSVREGYLEHLLKLGGVTQEHADEVAARTRERLDKALALARCGECGMQREPPPGIWSGHIGGPERLVQDVDTGVDAERLKALLLAQTTAPEGFHVHPKLKRAMDMRRDMVEGGRPLDWSAAEALAFASLAAEGIRIRLTGQDSARGAFSQRHAVLHDYETGQTYVPLQHVAPDQASVEIHDSPLSEVGVLGFEYGYSLECPDGLVAWEAQFGDFCNAAQVIIDQFITSAEDKWKRLSGLVLLLPHGFEGQGPEHSSARLERFLLLAADHNIQVTQPTTPAQYFHLLRRQMLRPLRKPLVVLTPKSLLRHPKVVSTFDDLATGTFQRVIPDTLERKRHARRILLCSGKIYYDLAAKREELGRDDVAIVRVEQLYPLQEESLQAALATYADGTHVYWVQEEPENMGAWRYMRARFAEKLVGRLPLRGVYRAESASPATGSAAVHKLEQAQLIQKAFGDGGG